MPESVLIFKIFLLMDSRGNILKLFLKFLKKQSWANISCMYCRWQDFQHHKKTAMSEENDKLIMVKY